MLQKSPPAERLGCLCGIAGALLGMWLGAQSFAAHAAAERANNPGVAVDGTPILAALFIGFFVGGLLGTLIGAILSIFVPRKKEVS